MEHIGYGSGVTATGRYTYSNLNHPSRSHRSSAFRGNSASYSPTVRSGISYATAYGAPWDRNGQSYYYI